MATRSTVRGTARIRRPLVSRLTPVLHVAVEVMYETWAWQASQMPAHAAHAARHEQTFLFVEVRDVAAIEAALPHGERFLERRETFYGAIEIGLREPGGHLVTFAQFKPAG